MADSTAAAKALYLSLVAEGAQFAAPLELGFAQGESQMVAARISTSLRALSSELGPQFEKAYNDGDYALARQIDRVLARADTLAIAANRAVVSAIDNSPDVAAALKAMKAVNTDLDKIKADVAADIEKLGDAKSVLDALAKLIGWL